MNLFGPIVEKRGNHIPSSYFGSTDTGCNIAILGTGDSYNRLQYLFQISKQTISQIVPEVY
jgi:hypothetical protein